MTFIFATCSYMNFIIILLDPGKDHNFSLEDFLFEHFNTAKFYSEMIGYLIFIHLSNVSDSH